MKAAGKWLGLILAVVFCGLLLTYGVTQEVPVGKLSGRIVMKENGKPLPEALVTLSLQGVPDDERPQVRGVETNADGEFAFRDLPAGDYHLAVSASEHQITPMSVTIEEGKTRTAELTASPSSPHLELYASQRVFTPEEKPKVELHGFVPRKDAVHLAVYRLDLEQIAKKGGLEEAISPLASWSDESRAQLQKVGQRILDQPEAIKDRDAEGAFVQYLPVGRLGEGVYLVTCAAGDVDAKTLLIVSHLALVTKSERDRVLCYTADIATGQPVAGAQILAKKDDALAPVGETGADGTLSVPVAADGTNPAFLARRGDSLAVVGFSRGDREAKPVWIDAYCERPAYRPGDTVFFKGFVRRVAGDGYALPGPGTVEVQVNDPDGNPLQKMSLPLSAHGSFNGSFATSPESKPGGYNLICRALGGESAGVYANVVAYRKPEFSIDVKPVKRFYTMGDRAAAVVECKYYYGGPVVGAKIKANIFRSPADTFRNEDGEEETVPSYGGGEYSEDVEAVTDASGRAVIEFDTRADDDPDVFTNDYDYTVDASITEDGGKYFDGQGQVRVVRGGYDLEMEVQNPILTPGQTADLLVKTTDPVDPSKPVAGREVVIEAGREQWSQDASVFVPRARYTAVTGPDGTAHVMAPIDRAEPIDFRAMGHDDQGRAIVAETSAYVVGSPAEADAERGDLKVTLDKRQYSGGDVAKALIQTDMPGGSALVCVQTDRILWKSVVPLTSGATLVNVPVLKEYAPNVYVGVAYVRNKHFLQADKRLKVDREDRKLKIEVKSDRDVYKPGDTARITVRTTDAEGRPVPADVSVGVVDRGIYDIASDDTDLYASLYPERSNEVATNYSFPEIYLDGGDKGSSKIPLRTNFKDTAGWNPTVWTGESGEATVSMTLPDNLTEWRITAVGLSDTSMAGIATAAFRAKKDLMLRLELPQYLVEGDHQRATVMVANDTGRDADVHVELGATGVQLGGDLRRTVRVPSGQPQVVDMDVVAGAAGPATFTARAWIDGGPTDGVRQSFPIHPHGRPVLETRAGEGAVDVAFRPRADLSPTYGSLKVSLSPTLAGNLVKALDGLIDYPYGCVEQTMSRFMPSVLVEHAVRTLGLPKPANLADLPAIVRDSLARLDKMRHSDGGWGWWEYDDSDPFMTALVLDGLDRARSAGYDVSAARPDGGVRWALQQLGDSKTRKKMETRDRLYLVYALLRWNKREAIPFLKGIDLRDRIEKTPWGTPVRKPTAAELATAVLTYKEAGMARQASECLDRLAKRAQVGEEIVHWPSEDGAWGEEPTALALSAFEAVRPNDPLVPRIVRDLMATRRGDGWESTRDTAYSLIGLTQYLEQTKELSAGPSTAQVLVNGQVRATVAMDPKVLDDPARNVEVPRRELGQGPVRVEIRPSGGGRCYFTLALSGLEVSQALAAEATDRGLQIERKYYRLEARALENGDMRLLPSLRPVTKFANGDLVRVELTIRSDAPRDFVLVEEPTPSNCRITERDDLDEGGGEEAKTWWWSRTVILDDHLAFFARNLPKGESKIVYNMRAEQAGEAHALPTTVRNMYDPGRWASDAEDLVGVTR